MSLAAAIGHVQPADIACEYLVGGSRCDQPRADRLRLRPHETVRVCTAHADELRCPVEGCEWVGQVCPDHGGGQPRRPRNIGLAASRGTSKAAGLWPAAPPRAATRTRASFEADEEEEDMAPTKRKLTPTAAAAAYKKHGTLKAAAAALGESPSTVRRRMLEHPSGRRMLGESPQSTAASAKPGFDYSVYDLSEVWAAFQLAGGVRSYAEASGVTYHQARRLVELAKAQQQAGESQEATEGQVEVQPEASQAPATAEEERLPACPSCGVGLHAHSGLAGTCGEVQLLRSRLGTIAGGLARETKRRLAVEAGLDELRGAWAGACAALNMPPKPPAAVVAMVRALLERRDSLIEQLAAEEEAAAFSGGILSDVCDILFGDAERAHVNGYEGVRERARAVMTELTELTAEKEVAASAWHDLAAIEAVLNGDDDGIVEEGELAARVLALRHERDAAIAERDAARLALVPARAAAGALEALAGGRLRPGQDLGDGLVAVFARDLDQVLAAIEDDLQVFGREADRRLRGAALRLSGAAALAHPAPVEGAG